MFQLSSLQNSEQCSLSSYKDWNVSQGFLGNAQLFYFMTNCIAQISEINCETQQLNCSPEML